MKREALDSSPVSETLVDHEDTAWLTIHVDVRGQALQVAAGFNDNVWTLMIDSAGELRRHWRRSRPRLLRTLHTHTLLGLVPEVQPPDCHGAYQGILRNLYDAVHDCCFFWWSVDDECPR